MSDTNAVLFGDLRDDGKIRVWRTIHSQPNQAKLKSEDHLDGYAFDKLPENPTPVRGKDQIMLFDPKTKEFEWEEKDRPLNESERMEVQTEALQRNNELLEELIAELKAKNIKA